MPALFAYLIVIGLLLGGGYGALSWLAAPEPVKVAAKAKPKPPSPPHQADNSEPIARQTTPPEPSQPEIGDKTVSSDKTASVDQSPSLLPPSEPRPEAAAPDTKAAGSGRTQDQPNRSAHAEMTPPGANPDANQSAEASSPGNRQAVASIAPAAAAKATKRPHLRQASRHSEKRGLALMTLRTIEFSDGRRVSQLIPYRRGERALAFEPDQ
ncbi:MAG: hypothetical protein ACXWLT_13890 [Rhizomicrobium sp.]